MCSDCATGYMKVGEGKCVPVEAGVAGSAGSSSRGHHGGKHHGDGEHRGGKHHDDHHHDDRHHSDSKRSLRRHHRVRGV